jgi:hypothetical protein
MNFKVGPVTIRVQGVRQLLAYRLGKREGDSPRHHLENLVGEQTFPLRWSLV